MRGILLLLVTATLWTAFAGNALAKDLPPEIRRMAERAFLEGRLNDLDTILAGASTPLDRFPLVMRDAYWREGEGAHKVPTGDSLLDRRYRWVLGSVLGATPRNPYPLAGSGGEDPYPVLTALILDRERRESAGATGLPEQGPLAALANQLDGKEYVEERWLINLLAVVMEETYRGSAQTPEQMKADRDADKLRDRAHLIFLATLGAFLVLSFFAALVVGRNRP